MTAYKQRLGRGLAALIGDDADEEIVMDEAPGFRRIPIELLHANPHNPRRRFEAGRTRRTGAVDPGAGRLAAADRSAPQRWPRLRDRRRRTPLACRAAGADA
jgi:hypothetical protein